MNRYKVIVEFTVQAEHGQQATNIVDYELDKLPFVGYPYNIIKDSGIINYATQDIIE